MEDEFHYKQTEIAAYLGQDDGVVSGTRDCLGSQVWIACAGKDSL